MKVKMLCCVQACGRVLDAGAAVCLDDILAARLIASGRAEAEDAFAVDALASAPNDAGIDGPKKKRAKK